MMYQPISIVRNEEQTDLYRAQQSRSRHSVSSNRARKLQVQRQKRTIMFTVAAMILGIFLASSVFGTDAKASGSDQASETYKYYTQIYVESGDTLWSIAKQHTDGSVEEITSYMDEVREINSISKYEVLKSGTYITVPYYSSEYLY